MLKRLRVLIISCLVSLMLGGCVHSDIGIEFSDQTHGKIVQHIRLAEGVTNFGSDALDEWLPSLRRRAKLLNGKAKQLSNQEIEVTIPFDNGADLQKKFSAFFNPMTPPSSRSLPATEGQLPQFASDLRLKQNNLIFALRNRINLELDLTSLALVASEDNVIVGAENLIDLEFRLITPWGARVIGDGNPDSDSNPTTEENGKLVVWTLKPGDINRLEAIFWVPSPVGIGTAIIAVFAYFGFLLKYRLLSPTVTPAANNNQPLTSDS
ncbi:MAG: DUF3153 domain-containing protein [Limnospira sp. PMC 1281.21]|uniref:DUF3153 domain-containing protein n=1 Tax=Limnospira sp. PMC 1281.21 TaxID=2981064 RepID=UPI0028E16450|nr:DUF3153 domain-containing protein [Limnospira sp. PMC 1281.21]MDT9299163.1 DUF3153 domain-containing protein [Limnospira sp. PMC 1281.21]